MVGDGAAVVVTATVVAVIAIATVVVAVLALALAVDVSIIKVLDSTRRPAPWRRSGDGDEEGEAEGDCEVNEDGQEEGEAERAELAALRQELAQLASAVHDRLARGDTELDDLKANLARLMDKLAERKAPHFDCLNKN